MRRFLVILCAVFFTFSHAAEAKTKKHKNKSASHKISRQVAKSTPSVKGNPRHAALVMNADTGQILLNENAYAVRYPASLTKMMTLYLTFDALKSGKLKWNQMLSTSRVAASQPQTNLFLNEGDRISVQTCVLALIVRSANDAAYVLGETLGGSKENFAYMMTEQARKLGMNNTVFRNPNGLPDNAQHTTAFDMAKLGIALRRDFPQYYPMFKTQQFSFNGRNYTGHNRVLNRLDGVDGIKTGYIGASGFNLVSSIKKDGVSLVGVVMGGRSGAERDNYMVSILKKNYDQQYALLHGGAQSVQVAEATKNESVLAKVAAATPSLISNAQAEEVAPVKTENIVAVKEVAVEPAKSKAPLVTVAVTAPSKPKSNTLDYQMASLADKAGNVSKISAAETSKPWGIQVGAYSDKASAKQAIDKVLAVVGKNISNPSVAIASEGKKGNAIHRARLGNLTRKEAQSACQKLQAANSPCFALMVSN
jgi:D-alanyl-D-alanine carboxypeptidase